MVNMKYRKNNIKVEKNKKQKENCYFNGKKLKNLMKMKKILFQNQKYKITK